MSIMTELKNIQDTEIIFDADMSKYTTFRAGGKVNALIFPETLEALGGILRSLLGGEYMPLGGGSNLLVCDEGYDGIMVSTGRLTDITLLDSETVYAQAGAKLSSVCAFAHAHGLTGMEFAGGIPGTVGGGVFMNAGAYGGELKDIILYADVLDTQGVAHRMEADTLDLGYRHSALMDHGGFIAGAAFCLKRGDVSEAKALLSELNRRRREKQPTELPSAGSTFKRPVGYFAGALIEQSGLKGKRIGGAQVSEKHCGFIVNTGGATAGEILDLIRLVQKTVYEKQGVMLEPEVRIVGGR